MRISDWSSDVCSSDLEGNDPGMIFRRWSPADSLAPGHASVGQPLPEAPAVVPDAIIAPLLAFDRRLNRLGQGGGHYRSEEHTFELQSLMRISYAVFCLKKKNKREQHISELKSIIVVTYAH